MKKIMIQSLIFHKPILIRKQFIPFWIILCLTNTFLPRHMEQSCFWCKQPLLHQLKKDQILLLRPSQQLQHSEVLQKCLWMSRLPHTLQTGRQQQLSLQLYLQRWIQIRWGRKEQRLRLQCLQLQQLRHILSNTMCFPHLFFSAVMCDLADENRADEYVNYIKRSRNFTEVCFMSRHSYWLVFTNPLHNGFKHDRKEQDENIRNSQKGES